MSIHDIKSYIEAYFNNIDENIDSTKIKKPLEYCMRELFMLLIIKHGENIKVDFIQKYKDVFEEIKKHLNSKEIKHLIVQCNHNKSQGIENIFDKIQKQLSNL